ncbi:hypothetical protein LSCM1_02815 [Leishmania martiniquensis]|uniref:Uncharacterized protein n=1 Tax=Leishmania martiniquensis TaxID=1580590 RepID=A0A836GAA7_9TRYP|nr:hypothetical protein LSCM1_02815 [Leishmania martiniquensis]
MSTYHQTHSSRRRRPKLASSNEEATQSLEEMKAYYLTSQLVLEEPPAMPTRPTEKRSDVHISVDDTLQRRNTVTSPNSTHGFKEDATSTKGFVPVRGYMTVSTSDSVESAIVFHSCERAAAMMVSGLLSDSDHKGLCSSSSPTKVASDTAKATLMDDDHDVDAEDAVDRNTEDDNVGNRHCDGVLLRLYRPEAGLQPERVSCQESPLPPAVLKMQFPAGGASGRRCNCSSGSREQGGGRYPTLSQSSRFEDVYQLPVHGREMCKNSNFSVGRTRGMAQDDQVCSSSVDSFSVEGSGATFQMSSSPKRIESSANSQFAVQPRQPRNGRNAPPILGVSRYESVTSPIRSPQVSADVSSHALMTVSGPHFVSSDQMALFSRLHGQHRHTHPCHHQHNYTGRRPYADAVVDGGGGVEGRVPSIPSASPSSCDGEAALKTSLSLTDGFDLVRAPITGLRAILLGNNTVEEEEAAENPEMRALQAEQLKHFYSKVVRQHRDGAKSRVSACGLSPPRLTTRTYSSAQESWSLGVDTAANGLALGRKASVSTLSQPCTHANNGTSVVALASAVERTFKKQERKVVFNIDGIEQLHTKDGGTVHTPHRGTPQPTGALVQRAPSPLTLQCGSTDIAFSSGVADANDSVTWGSPPPPLLLRLGWKARARPEEPGLAATKDSPVASAGKAVLLKPLSMTPGQEASSVSAEHTSRREAEGDDNPLTSLLTASTSANLAQQPSVTPTSVVKAMPPPPGPPLTTVAQLSLVYAEEPRKRRCYGCKMLKASKKRREAAMAVATGANDAIVLQKWSTSFTLHAPPPHAHLASPNILSTTEVCPPHHGSRAKGSTKPQRLPKVSPFSAVAQAPFPFSLHSGVSGTRSAYHKEGGTVTTVSMPPSLRTVQVVPDHNWPCALTQQPTAVASTVTTATAGLTVPKQKEQAEEAVERGGLDAKAGIPQPLLPSCRPASGEPRR